MITDQSFYTHIRLIRGLCTRVVEETHETGVFSIIVRIEKRSPGYIGMVTDLLKHYEHNSVLTTEMTKEPDFMLRILTDPMLMQTHAREMEELLNLQEPDLPRQVDFIRESLELYAMDIRFGELNDLIERVRQLNPKKSDTVSDSSLRLIKRKQAKKREE